MHFFTKLTTSKINTFFYNWKNILASSIILVLILILETVAFSVKVLEGIEVTNLFILLNSLLIISFTIFITTIYFKDDFKNKKISLERRYGVSTSKIFWSRILASLTLVLIFIGFILLYNLILISASRNWSSISKYRLLISSIGWYTILALISFTVSLFFMSFLKTALAIVLVFLLSFGMISDIVFAPASIPERIQRNEYREKDTDYIPPLPSGTNVYFTNSSHSFLESLGDETNNLQNWKDFYREIDETINLPKVLLTENKLSFNGWTIQSNRNEDRDIRVQTKDGMIFNVPKKTDYLAFGLDVFKYLLENPEPPTQPEENPWGRWTEPGPTQKELVRKLYSRFPEIINFYRYFNDLYDSDENLKNEDIFKQLDYLKDNVEEKYEPLIKFLKSEIIVADKNSGFDGTLSWIEYYDRDWEGTLGEAGYITNFLKLNLEEFNFSKVAFFRALNRCFYRFYINKNNYNSQYNSQSEEVYKHAKDVRHYKNYYKKLKKELIFNPGLHFVTLFHSTNYNNPKLANLLNARDSEWIDSIENYYFDHDIMYPQASKGTDDYIKDLKKAKMHQLIHPEVYYIVYTLINFGIIGIGYAIFYSKIKRNKF